MQGQAQLPAPAPLQLPADQLLPEQVLVPEHGDITEVAWPPFSFWNPDAKRYETLDERPVPLKVRGSLAAQVQPVGNIPSATSSKTQMGMAVYHSR